MARRTGRSSFPSSTTVSPWLQPDTVRTTAGSVLDRRMTSRMPSATAFQYSSGSAS
jgi:hypothetical protein